MFQLEMKTSTNVGMEGIRSSMRIVFVILHRSKLDKSFALVLGFKRKERIVYFSGTSQKEFVLLGLAIDCRADFVWER